MPNVVFCDSKAKRTMQALAPAFVLLLLAGTVLAGTNAPDVLAGSNGLSVLRSEDVIPDWTSLPWEPYPLMPAVLNNPVLDRFDVTDASAQFVADPFLFYLDGTWFMFFEVWNAYGKIGLAMSTDGLDWTYLTLIIDGGIHHSFPHVFYYDGEYYMITETSYLQSVQIHRATNFPFQWEEVSDLITGREYVDPSIFRYDGRWWMFVGVTGSADCHLFYSDSLLTGWVEHPESPIVQGNRSKARPAGRTIVLDNGRIIRTAQKCDVAYGEAVRAFEVDLLDRYSYSEHEIPESPILNATGDGWNAEGMHQFDPWWNGSYWIAAVDGWGQALSWSIGIYRTQTENSVPPNLAQQILRLAPNVPNPFGSSTRITYELLDVSDAAPVHLGVYDSRGRRIRTLVDGDALPGIHGATWDGTDSDGRSVPGGIYFYRLDMGENRSITKRMALVR